MIKKGENVLDIVGLENKVSSRKLIIVMLWTFIIGWFIYFFLFLISYHFTYNVNLDFLLHDKYSTGYTDFFRDFFEVNFASAKGDCYLTGTCANYPPLALVIARIMAVFTPDILDTAAVTAKDTFEGRMLLIAFFTVTLCFCFTLYYNYFLKQMPRFRLGRTTAVILSIVCIFSYSVIYGIERGNYIILALIVFIVFVFTYEKYPKVSAVALAVCACLKVYPVILFLVFLLDKKYREFIIGMFTGIIGLFLPMIFLKGNIFQQFRGLLNGILSFNSTSQAEGGIIVGFDYLEQHSNSFSNLLRSIALWVSNCKWFEPNKVHVVLSLQTANIILTFMILLIAILGLVSNKQFWKRVCIIVCILHLLPSNTYDYMLSFFIPILVLSVCYGNMDDKKYIIMLTLLSIIPKSYYFFPYGAEDVSIQCVLNPLLMVLILLEFFWDGIEIYAKNRTLKDQIKTEYIMFDVNASNFIKSFAIAQIVYFHVIGCTDETGYIMVVPAIKRTIANYGYVGVIFFLFLSAYGYTKQSEGQMGLKNYIINLRRRLASLYSDYWFSFLLIFILSPLLSSGWMDFRKVFYNSNVFKCVLLVILNMFGLTHLFYGDNIYTLNQAWWYMSLAVLLIVFFPFLLCIYRRFKIQTTGVIMFISIIVANVKYVQYILPILLGVIFASEKVFERINYLHRRFISVRVIEIITGGLVFAWWYYANLEGKCWYSLANDVYLLVTVVLLFNFIYTIKPVQKLLSTFGRYSANIFYVHSWLYFYCIASSRIFFSLKYDLLIWVSVFMASLLLSYAFEIIKNKINWNEGISFLWYGRTNKNLLKEICKRRRDI